MKSEYSTSRRTIFFAAGRAGPGASIRPWPRLALDTSHSKTNSLPLTSVEGMYEFTFRGIVTRLGRGDRNRPAYKGAPRRHILLIKPRLRGMHACTNPKSSIYISPPAKNTCIHTHGRPHLGPGHWRHHRDLLARRGRSAAPTSVPGRRQACIAGRPCARPAPEGL